MSLLPRILRPAALLLLTAAVLRADALDEWTWRSPEAKGSFKGENYNGLAYAAGTLVIAAGNGRVLVRQDAAGVWLRPETGTQRPLYGVATANQVFYAVGARGTVITSKGGETWVARNSTVTEPIFALTYTDSTFAGVGAAGTVVTSGRSGQWSSQASSTRESLFGVA